MLNKGQIPDQQGLYWAKNRYIDHWTMIVSVGGDAPMLYVDKVWFVYDGTLRDCKSWEIDVWGPRIERPHCPSSLVEKKP